MHRLLATAALLIPVLAIAQVPYHRFIHSKQFVLYKPVHLYQCLDDTLMARPLQLDSGQVVSLQGYVNEHWWILNQFINHTYVDFYVRREELVIVPYEPPIRPSKQRKRLLHTSFN